MKLIYANIVWFGILIIGITNANLGRFTSEDWGSMEDVRLKYTLLYGVVTLLLAASITGLLLKKKWGYELALASNTSMALLPIALFIASFIMLPALSPEELLSSHALNLIVGLVSLIFWLAQVRSRVKYKCVT